MNQEKEEIEQPDLVVELALLAARSDGECVETAVGTWGVAVQRWVRVRRTLIGEFQVWVGRLYCRSHERYSGAEG